MELLERVFKSILAKKSSRRSSALGPDFLKSQAQSLELISGSILSPKFRPQIVASRNTVGIRNQSLYLPFDLSCFEDPLLARKILLNLVLQSSAAFNLKLTRINADTRADLSPIDARLAFLSNITECNRYLDNLFDHYKDLQDSVFDLLTAQRSKNRSGSLELFQFWQTQFRSRESHSPTHDLSINFLKHKTNSAIPSFLLYSVPCYVSQHNSFLAKPQGLSSSNKQQANRESKTEVEKPHDDSAERTDLTNQEVNPVTHSFEKMETADEYQGGNRVDSGSDELQDHSEALSELNLKKITRDGEAAKSIYRSELASLESELFDGELSLNSKFFYYPEWNFHRASYKLDYCQIFVNPLELQRLQSDFKSRVLRIYANQIHTYRREIQNLQNSPLWFLRQPEGDEIDCDSYVRDYVAIRAKRPPDGRWYSRKLKHHLEIDVAILFDQSLSSDSWVKAHRVIDLMTEAIGLAGLLLGGSNATVQVSGAWSSTRSNCSFQIYKDYDDDWSFYFDRAPQIEPQGYTRLGPPIRHASRLLSQRPSRHKLLLLLTDGKPTDLDGYEGRYGIEDVKQACLEAEQKGILVFALTIENQSKHYFQKMFPHHRLLSDPNQFSRELHKVLLQVLGRSLR